MLERLTTAALIVIAGAVLYLRRKPIGDSVIKLSLIMKFVNFMKVFRLYLSQF